MNASQKYAYTDRKGAVAKSQPFDAKSITKVVKEGIACVQAAKTMEDLKAAKTKYAGAQSAMTLASKAIGSLPVEEKKEAGKECLLCVLILVGNLRRLKSVLKL